MASKRPADDIHFNEPPTKVQRPLYEEDVESNTSSAYMNLLALIAESEGMRILRAEEEDGTDIKTHDFAVFSSTCWFLKLPDTRRVSESVRRIGAYGG